MKRLIFLVLFFTGLVSAQPMPQAVGKDVTHQSSPGDNLYTVARSYRLGLEHLSFANQLPVNLADLGQKMVVVPQRRILPFNPPTDGLVLNLPERGIFRFRDGQYKDFYPVAIGGLGWQTPVGKFSIKEKVINPVWYPPAWAGIPGAVGPGPANPLGDRWIGLSIRGYGLHSTNRPNSIGGAVSHGCIRLYPEMVRELYEKVEVGMTVRIEYEPIKLGQDEDGHVYLAVFPDVYRRVSLNRELRDKLEHHKLSKVVSWQGLRPHLKASSGLAIPVLEKRVDPEEHESDSKALELEQ